MSKKPDSQRTTITIPGPTYERAEQAWRYELARGILPSAISLPQYLVGLIERQLLGQAEGWADAPPWRPDDRPPGTQARTRRTRSKR